MLCTGNKPLQLMLRAIQQQPTNSRTHLRKVSLPLLASAHGDLQVFTLCRTPPAPHTVWAELKPHGGLSRLTAPSPTHRQ